MTIKRCRKCQRQLPQAYKYANCENCRSENVQTWKDAGKALLGLLVVAVGIKGGVDKFKQK